MGDTKFGMGRVLDNIGRMKNELPVVLANQAQRHFVDSWREQGFEGTPWKEVNRRIEGTKEWKYPKMKGLGRRTRAILVKTGQLKRAVGMSIRAKSFELVHLVVDTPYAEYHNEGTDDIPARPFMKDTPVLRKMQEEKITEFIDNVWK